MKVADLSEAAVRKIRRRSFDRLIEKHEGPEDWSVFLNYVTAFLEIDGLFVLLPLELDELEKVTILNCIPSQDGNTLTVFLRNRRYSEAYNIEPNSDRARFYEGFVAICSKIADEDFFVADFYHEWFIVKN